MKILNLTQHVATPEQQEGGVFEPQQKDQVKDLLTFSALPVVSEVKEAARSLAAIAANSDCDAAMIGGAPFLMSPLQSALAEFGVISVYAFSVRESKEEVMPDGSVQKVSAFIHKGWVEAC